MNQRENQRMNIKQTMQMLMRVLAAIGVFALISIPATAQYPAKPIRIVVPFPGGPVDALARIVGQPLSQVLGQPVVVEDKPGADGAIAAEFVARSAPDGYTLFCAGNSQMLGVPTLRKNPPYDPVADFTPITSLARFSLFLAVHPSVPAKTLAELIDYLRANPGKLNYGTGNVSAILASAQLMSLGKVDMVHVPYKGEAQAMPDLVSARVQLMFATGRAVAPLVREGRLRALATLLAARSSLLPDVPTIAEAGMPQLSIVIWAGLFAPAKTPKEIVERLSREVNAILKRPEIRERLEKQALEPGGSTPNELEAFLKQQLVEWRSAARAAGLKPE
jgi:tripartite-type tricarboxylate transporter receptor subunit TctC